MSDIVSQIGRIGDKKISRRTFLKASGALAAVGCADSARQNIYPNVKGTEDQVPGVSTWYRSVCTECTAGCGIEVRTREGRAVKIEGNRNHPVNRGGLCAQGQSSLQGLYDPDRVRQPLKRAKDAAGNPIFQPADWVEVYEKIATVLVDKSKKKAIITGEVSGSLGDLLKDFSEKFGVTHAVYDALSPITAVKAAEMTYGSSGLPRFAFDQAEVVVNFGADFLETWVSPCEFAKDWSKSRKSSQPLRVFHIEPRLSLTGANADKWIQCAPGTELDIALALIKALVDRGVKAGGEDVFSNAKDIASKVSFEAVAKKSGVSREKIISMADYLATAKSSLILAGGAAANTTDGLSLHVAAGVLNVLLGNVGKTVDLGKTRKYQSSAQAVKSLIDDLNKGEVKLLMVDGSNPLFTLPKSIGLEYGIRKAQLVVSFSSKLDETSKLADFILPSSVSLESWGDSRPYAGVYGLVQPAMTPIFDTKALGDILVDLANGVKEEALVGKAKNFQEYVKLSWQKVHAGSSAGVDFEKFWNESLERGGYFEAANGKGGSGHIDGKAYATLRNARAEVSVKKDELILYPYVSIKTFDGSSANRPWMQELPDPITEIIWDAWAELHPDTAKRFSVVQGDFVTVRNSAGEINVPVYVTEYVHKDVIAVPIGNGHTTFGRYAEKVGGGSNVVSLVSASAVNEDVATVGGAVTVLRGRDTSYLVNVDGSRSQMGREIARTKVISEASELHDHGHGDHAHHHEPKQMYEQREHPLYRWAMAIDLAACTGCSACVVACYAENNIPMVGKEIAHQGREMSWLRIDRYYDGTAEELTVHHMPMLCQHCDNAPCEPVCPVYATYHGEEGLNVMVYNRCVGTRYCANNCSYKVRRFNWFEYTVPEPLNWQFNPDVVVRTAGVMEKCTFCSQRIMEAKDRAKDIGRPVLDGEIQPACAQSCPTDAIVFGDANDPTSKVSKLAKTSRSYKVLDHHLNTQPAITYLEDIKYR